MKSTKPDSTCFYILLGVARTASPEEIKKAHKRRSFESHPDKNASSVAAGERQLRLNLAAETLGDPKSRALYDEFGEAASAPGFDAAQARSAAARAKDPRTRPADYLITVMLDRGALRTDQKISIIVPRLEMCRACLGSGLRWIRCDACAGYGRVIVHVGCHVCAGHGVLLGAAGIVPCMTCGTRGSVPSMATCAPCRGAQAFREDCAYCGRGGVVTAPSLRTITVPANVEEGQSLRIAGKSPTPGGDLFVKILFSKVA